MFLFVSIIGVLIWAAFWGAIRLERTMGVAPLPDRDTAPPDQEFSHGNLQTQPQVMEQPEHIPAVRGAVRAMPETDGKVTEGDA